ncbi:MAG: AAA family ATPase [Bacteroidales bacterium]|nr:AAA family ATPase [Bacteroidales bacterium]
MFIKSIQIKNFKLFSPSEFFEISDLNIPDGQNKGSGLTIFVGENGCGKSTLLDAFAMPYVSYKTDSFSISDINNPSEKVEINILTNQVYTYKGTMPRVEYKGKGFSFLGGIRSRGTSGYLASMVVTDQKYIKADGETKPLDNTPDLRLAVNNPWSGSRFSEIEYLILDKNRTFQTRKGTYNDTRFDRIMEDLNYQYLQKENTPIDCNDSLKEVKELENRGVFVGIGEAIAKFSELSGKDLKLKLIDNWKPFTNAFFGTDKENLQSIPLNQLGSGYEMIFSLIYSYYLSKKGNKKLIVLIDEPELHLHPKLQSDFVELLLEFSKDSQIILTTHSPLFIKQSMSNSNVQVKILTKTNDSVSVANPDLALLPYVSANEVNFIAFKLATEEYHNELYERLMQLKATTNKIKDFDVSFFQTEKGEPKNSPWMGHQNEVTIHTFIRNQIHHRTENGKAEYKDLKDSVEKMRQYLIEINDSN